VAFCAEFGITIEDWEWPSHHLPEGLLADRGEIESVNGDHLANAFNIRVHNTAPGRADMKGIVEQHFDLTNEKIIKWSPGAVRKRERGDRDYRLDARLDLQQFRRIILLSVLDHNKNHRMDGYHFDQAMIADGVDPYPLDLWHWGVKNRSGHLRTVSKERLRLNLLPEFEASITQSGIICEDLAYTCDLAVREQWFEGVGEGGREKIRVARDPRNLSQIYLRLDNGARMEVCYLKDSDQAFRNRESYEAADEFELRKQRKALARGPSLQAAVSLQAEFQAILDEAERMTPEGLEKLSNRSRVAGIRENRRSERDRERQANGWELGEPAPLDLEIERGLAKGPSSQYIPPAQPTQSLRESIQRRARQ
jgi:putative transposase